MIGKIKKGKGFRGLLNYTLQKPGARIVGGNMAGADERALAQEFAVFRALKPGLGRAVFHSALSLPDGESLSDEQWGRVAEQYAAGMGFGESAWLAVRHMDTEHDHIHFVASRIAKNGDVVSDGQDYKRQEKTIREIEKTFGLTPLPVNQKPAPKLSQAEIGKAERTGQIPHKLMIATAIDQAIQAGVKDEGELAEELSKSNIETQIHAASTGRVSGLSFRLHGVIEWLKGSSIGKAYSHLNIKKRIEEHGKNKRHAANGGWQGEAHTVGDQPAGRAADANAVADQGVERTDPLGFLDEEPAANRNREHEEGHDRSGAADQVAAVSNRYLEKLDQTPATVSGPVAAATTLTQVTPAPSPVELEMEKINRIKKSRFLLIRRDPLQKIPVEVLDGLEGVTDSREALQAARAKGFSVIEYPGEIENFRASNTLVGAIEEWKKNRIIEMNGGDDGKRKYESKPGRRLPPELRNQGK